MEYRENAELPQPRNKGLMIVAVLLGLINLADYLHASGQENHRLLAGTGFLLLAPQLYRSSPRLSWKRDRTATPSARQRFDLIQGLGWLGVAMITAGMAMQFFG